MKGKKRGKVGVPLHSVGHQRKWREKTREKERQ